MQRESGFGGRKYFFRNFHRRESTRVSIIHRWKGNLSEMNIDLNSWKILSCCPKKNSNPQNTEVLTYHFKAPDLKILNIIVKFLAVYGHLYISRKS